MIKAILDEIKTKVKMMERQNKEIKNKQEYLEHTRREIENMKKEIENKLNNFAQIQIPAHVAKEMAQQITNYLSNHIAMQDILSHHAGRLNAQLYSTAEEILNNIVKEERYHTLYNKLENEIKNRIELMIEEKKKVWIEQMQMHEIRFNKMLNEHKNKIEEELSRISKVNKKIDELYDYSNSLQTQNYVLAVISVISLSISGLSLFYVFNR